jgi:hypothetical protein
VRAARWFVVLLASIGPVPTGRAQVGQENLLSRVDHLVYTTPDLQVGVNTIEELLGVRATTGGQHPGLGTRNALVALGPSSYLEIIGPDPEQPTPPGKRRFGIDDLRQPRLFTWVAKGTELDALAAKASTAGVGIGRVLAGSRRRPDGALLTWRYTDPDVSVADRLVPYFIDWGASPHPSLTAAPGATLIAMRAEHPDAPRVQTMFATLGLTLVVERGPRPSLIATIRGPKGQVELRN